MTDDGTKITIRMGPEVIQAMEDFMAENDIGNRSDFVRCAVEYYIQSQKNGMPPQMEGGVFVHLSDMQLDILTKVAMDGTLATSVEEFIRACVLEKIVPADVKAEIVRRALESAQQSAMLK